MPRPNRSSPHFRNCLAIVATSCCACPFDRSNRVYPRCNQCHSSVKYLVCVATALRVLDVHFNLSNCSAPYFDSWYVVPVCEWQYYSRLEIKQRRNGPFSNWGKEDKNSNELLLLGGQKNPFKAKQIIVVKWCLVAKEEEACSQIKTLLWNLILRMKRTKTVCTVCIHYWLTQVFLEVCLLSLSLDWSS